MSTISTGVGLVSGLNINDLVDSLMSIQQKPLQLLQQRVTDLTSRRTAWIQITAQLLGVQNAAARIAGSSSFLRTSATTSDNTVAMATADSDAMPGQYSFTIRQLATKHQLISSGFATRDRTPVGGGTITVETAAGKVNHSTSLGILNGGAGVRAGRIRIMDRAGQSAEIDLRGATSIDDVVRAINSQSTAAVTARIEGSHLVLVDQTGQAAGSLVVSDIGEGHAAEDLGLLVGQINGTITGRDLVSLSDDTRLADINDGNGVRVLMGQKNLRITLADGTALDYELSGRLSIENRDNGDGTFTDLSTPLALLNHGAGVAAGSIRVTNRAGLQTEINLSSAQTIADVANDSQWAAAGISVTVSGSHLVIKDNSTGTGTTQIEDIDSTAAADLGITGTTTGSILNGADNYSVDTIGDVLRALNNHVDNRDAAGAAKFVASLSSTGTEIILTDHTVGGGALTVEALNGSGAAEDLGLLQGANNGAIESRRLLAGLNTVLLRSLNGGSGVESLGALSLTDRSGATASVDLSGAATLADVIDGINGAGTGIVAAVSASGLGIDLSDHSNGAGSLTVADAAGSTVAQDLHIAYNGLAGSVSSGNLQRQYVSEATLLADYRGGVPTGKFRITDSKGVSAVVDLSQGNERTLQDVIDEINSRGLGVTARINNNGDGLLLEDMAGGGGTLSVAEEGGRTAAALGLLGRAATGTTFIDGSLEKRITLGAGDTLNDVLKKIQESGSAITAGIINDGTAGRPYRLSLTSNMSGRDGQLAIDAGTSGLAFTTLTEARDAVVLFGGDDSEAPLILTSSTNTLEGAVPGVRLNLVNTSQKPLTVTVARDVDGIVTDVSGVITTFNGVISKIDELTNYNAETQKRSVLTSDSTAQRVRQRLIEFAGKTVPGLTSTLNRLSRVGIALANGTSLQMDETKFRQALESDPQAVAELFTHEITAADGTKKQTGLAGALKVNLDQLLNADTGIITLQEDSIQSTQDMLNKRIAAMQTLLSNRRQRMLNQFYAMEETLGKLQSQQNALSGLTNLAATASVTPK